MTTIDIEKLASWSAPKEIQTKYGPKIFRRADVTSAFSALWKSHKEELKALGAGFSKNQRGDWELTWWQDLAAETRAQRDANREASRATSAEIDLPKPTGLDYMPFQKAGIRFALDKKNVLIADEMGLGKTIQAIGIINADSAIKTALIICPKSLKLNWQRELSRWLTRDLTVGVVNGTWPATDIVIVNYEGLGKWQDQIAARTWGACIADEAHLCKNKNAQRSKNMKSIKTIRKIRLTGTPIVNRPVELWNIIEDLDSEQFGNFWSFTKRYTNAYNNGYGWDFSGANNLDELQSRLRETIMVRRLKSDVLTELPAKIRQVIELEAETAEQKKAVRKESNFQEDSDTRMAGLRAAVELGKAESDEIYKTAVAALRDAMQVDFTEMSKLRHETALSKVAAVVAHVAACLEDNDNKIIIAAHHRDVVEQLASGLAEFRPVVLVGGMTEIERQNSVDTFQKNPDCRVFIGGIMAAGVGITLTASSQVVFAELDWVPGNITQMEDRAHRIGQTMPVLVQHIVLADSIDAHMAKVLIEKQAVIEQALDANHPERMQPVYEPKSGAATATTTRTEIEKNAASFTPGQIEEIHAKLRGLTEMDADMATARNEIGFSKIDVVIGHSLAEQCSLSPKQAVIGAKLVRRYKKQTSGLSWETA